MGVAEEGRHDLRSPRICHYPIQATCQVGLAPDSQAKGGVRGASDPFTDSGVRARPELSAGDAPAQGVRIAWSLNPG